MKICKKKLEIIIKEEIEATLNEFDVFGKGVRGAKIMGKQLGRAAGKARRGAAKMVPGLAAAGAALGNQAARKEYKRYFSERFAGNSQEAKSQALSYFARYMDSVKDYDDIIDILVDHYIKAGEPT